MDVQTVLEKDWVHIAAVQRCYVRNVVKQVLGVELWAKVLTPVD